MTSTTGKYVPTINIIFKDLACKPHQMQQDINTE